MKVIAKCWMCGKEEDISDKPVRPRKCTCGGWVITPSGKVQLRVEKKHEVIERR